jgi:hypothetical protein
MWAVGLLVLFALASPGLGFSPPKFGLPYFGLSPPPRHRDDPAWWSRYNFRALRKFLIIQVTAHPEIDGVPLSTQGVGRRWQEVAGGSRACGNWLFWEDQSNPAQFYFGWTYAVETSGGAQRVFKSVTFTCERISRSKFNLVKAARYDSSEVPRS